MGPIVAGIIALMTALLVSPAPLYAQELTPKVFFEQLEGDWEEIKPEGSPHHYYLSFRLRKNMLLITGHGSATAESGVKLHGRNDDKLFFEANRILKNRRVDGGSSLKIVQEPAALLWLNSTFIAYAWVSDFEKMVVEKVSIKIIDEEKLHYTKVITEDGELIVERFVEMRLKNR